MRSGSRSAGTGAGTGYACWNSMEPVALVARRGSIIRGVSIRVAAMAGFWQCIEVNIVVVEERRCGDGAVV